MADSRTRALRRLNCKTKGAVLPPLSHSSQVWLPVEKWEKCVITIISRYNCTTVFFARGDNITGQSNIQGGQQHGKQTYSCAVSRCAGLRHLDNVSRA